MSEIRRNNRTNHHDRRNIGQELRSGLIRKVRKHRDVLLIGFFHAVRAQSECGRPDEEHGEKRQQSRGNQDNLGGLLLGPVTVEAFRVQHELRNCRQEAEGEHQHRHDQDDVAEVSDEAIGAVVVERAEIPLRDQIQRHRCQRHDQRVDHELRDQQRGVAAEGKAERHQADAERRQDWARDFRAVQLVLDEAVDGVGDRDAVDHHDRKYREPVDQGDQNAGVFAEEAGDHFQDVLALLRGSAEHARVGAVRKECHGADQQGGYQKRPESEATGIDGQKEDAGTDCGTKQCQGPLRVVGFFAADVLIVARTAWRAGIASCTLAACGFGLC